MRERLISGLEKQGFRARVVPARRLEDLENVIEDLSRELLDERFVRTNLSGFSWTLPDGIPGDGSLMIVALRDPHVRFTFTRGGERIPVIVPATYLHFIEKDKRVRETVETLLSPEGYRVVEARVPKKTLAVRSGLARYGRNNVTYIPGFGSFYRMTALFSDLPCESDEWGEPRALEVCEDCRACMNACPTGAIGPDRFLLRAERCVTYWNEQPEGVPFPDWLDPAWHNCLVGCLYCQRACPENREVRDFFEEGEEFSEEETGLLLEGRGASELPADLVEKLERADLLPALDTMSRNLGAVLGSGRP